MSQASDPGAKLIASYRAATRMRPEQRERALRKLQARLSTDPTPSIRPEVSVPELPPQLPAAWLQLRARWRRFATVSKVIIGAALLTWLATEPDAHGGVAPVPLAAAAARPGSNAGAETEPRDPLSTPARSQLATPSDAASSGHRKSAPAAPHETHITSAGGASSKLAHMPRTAATPVSPPTAARSGAPALRLANAPDTPPAALPGRAPALGLSDAPDTPAAARSGRSRELGLSDAPENATAVRSGRAPERAMSDDAPDTPAAARSGRALERGLSDVPETPTAARPGRAPALGLSDASDLGAQDREAEQRARPSVDDARAAHQTRQQFTQRAGGAQLPERGARQLGAASLEQETLLLEQAQAALKRGDAERALHLLAEHTWLFPAGHLAEARDVARILALCQAGNAAQARLRAKSFLAARPRSPFAARVSSSCPDADKPPNAK